MTEERGRTLQQPHVHGGGQLCGGSLVSRRNKPQCWQLVPLVELKVCHHSKKIDIIGTILSKLTPVPILAIAAEALFLNVSG